jgi:hypothetical protein
LDSLEHDLLKAYLISYERVSIEVYIPDAIEVRQDTFTLASRGIDLLVDKDRDGFFTVTGGDYMVADEVDGALAKVIIYRRPNVSIDSGYVPVAKLVTLKYPNNNFEKVEFFHAQKRRLKRELKEVKKKHNLTDEQFYELHNSFVERLIQSE